MQESWTGPCSGSGAGRLHSQAALSSERRGAPDWPGCSSSEQTNLYLAAQHSDPSVDNQHLNINRVKNCHLDRIMDRLLIFNTVYTVHICILCLNICKVVMCNSRVCVSLWNCPALSSIVHGIPGRPHPLIRECHTII